MHLVPIGDLARRFLADPEASWSVGTFGAIAEFARDADEPCAIDTQAAQIVTTRGAIRIDPASAVRPIAYETISAASGSWNHGVALCLPAGACAMNGRSTVTELGVDRDACRSDGREEILFDIGVGAQHIDACVRTAEPELLAALRASKGRPLFEPGNPLLGVLLAFSPVRVFICQFGRVEVFQPIPPPGGQSPDGPHTHVLPKLLTHRRTHAATTPIPEGWIPCMQLFPAHPLKNTAGTARAFDRASHAAFEALLERFGQPEIVAVRKRAAAALRDAAAPDTFPLPETREERVALRAWLRQMAASEPDNAVVATWRKTFDNARDE